MLIIVKIAVKKFHLQKMPPLTMRSQWGLRARGKSMEHGASFDPFDKLRASKLPATTRGTGRTGRA